MDRAMRSMDPRRLPSRERRVVVPAQQEQLGRYECEVHRRVERVDEEDRGIEEDAAEDAESGRPPAR